MNRKFACAEKKRYSNEEKLALGELVRSCKEEYDAEVERNKGINCTKNCLNRILCRKTKE